MTNASSLLRTAVFAIFIAAAFCQFGFGGGPFQGQGGGGFRGPVQGGGFRGPPVGRGPAVGGQFNPFAGMFPQPQTTPEPPLPKGKIIKTKNKAELVEYLVGVISKNHERIAHITHHNYSEILEEEASHPKHVPSKLEAIQQALKLHNSLP